MSFRYRLRLIAVACLLLTGQVYADDTATITINGTLKSQTCNAKVNNGTADGTVTLPSVAVSLLASAAQVAGNTPFTVNLSGCAPSGTVTPYFQNNQATVNAAGRLSNTATTAPAQFVELQLLNAAHAVVNLNGAAQAQNASSVKVDANGSATLNFSIQYYATQSAAAGSVSSTLTYIINYF